MKRLISILAIFVCLSFVVPASFAAGKDNWISVRSKNFFLVGNASEKDIRQVAVKLEQFREAFLRLLPKIKFTSSIPTTVIVFKSDDAYKPYKPVVDNKVASDVAGYFQPGEDVNYITLSIEKRSEQSFRTIFHEYIHMLVNNTATDVETPTWFDEGLAEYYSTVQIKDDQKVILGHLIYEHLELLRSQDLWPLKTLFTIDNFSLRRNDSGARQFFYAQSWILFHYLFMGNEGRRQPQLDEFLRLLFTNVPLEEAFRKAFETDYATLEKELSTYLRRKTYTARSIEFDEKLKIDTGMQAAQVGEAQAQAYLGDLLLHIDRAADAETHLARALALDPSLGSAHLSLGNAFVKKKQFAEAKSHLQKAIALDPQNYLAHYYYARALIEEPMGESRMISRYSSDAAQAMRAGLRRAIELSPNFADSYHLLAFVNFVMGEQLDESVKLLRQALALSPGNYEYAILLAEIYLYKQDFKTASLVLEPIANKASSDRLRARAQSLLRSIKSAEEQMAHNSSSDNVAANERGAPSTLKRDEPPQAGNMSQEERFHAWLQQGLRKPVEGEQRAQGMLVNIECAPKNIVYTITVGDRLLKLRSDSFDNVDMLAHTDEVQHEVRCGPRKPESPVVVIYRLSADGRRKIDGDAISFEFVPIKFQLKQ
jgi:tetratricopeptide (TPR) repeat protein